MCRGRHDPAVRVRAGENDGSRDGGEVTKPKENKEILRRFVEEFQGRGDEAVADRILADDFVDHSPFPGVSPDRQGVKRLFGALRAAFPDLRAEIHDQLAERDRVATRKTFHGTHRGEFLGIAPTGQPVSFDVIDFVRVKNGRIAEHWSVVDVMGLMQQLGALKSG
jgi:steroid delta-isomerase-like uncharacterized protein